MPKPHDANARRQDLLYRMPTDVECRVVGGKGLLCTGPEFRIARRLVTLGAAVRLGDGRWGGGYFAQRTAERTD